MNFSGLPRSYISSLEKKNNQLKLRGSHASKLPNATNNNDHSNNSKKSIGRGNRNHFKILKFILLKCDLLLMERKPSKTVLNLFLVSKETVVLRRWERSKQKFGFIKRVDKG